MKNEKKIKWIWILTIFLVFTLLSFLLFNKYVSLKHKTITEKEINQVFNLNGTALAINLIKLKRLNSTFYYNYVRNPLPNNTRGTYKGFVVPLKTTYQTFNNDSFRSTKNYSFEKPKNVKRIVMIGDSFFFGAGVNDNETLSSYLETSLGKGYQVLNLAVAGFNTKLEVERLKQKGLKYHPDIVVVGYVSNDFEDTQIVQNLDHYIIKMALDRNMSMEKAWDIRLSFDYLKYFPFNSTFGNSVEKPLTELHKLSKEYNFSVIVIAYPLSYFLDEKDYKKLLENVCDKNNLPFFYLPDEINYQLKGKWVLDPKDVHPTPYANEMTAKFLKKIILKRAH